MPRRPAAGRTSARLVAVVAALALLALAPVAPGHAAGRVPAAGATPGYAGGPFMVADASDLRQWDLGTDSDGTGYLAWLSFDSFYPHGSVDLCLLDHDSGTGCTESTGFALPTLPEGGVHVVVTGPGQATLLWLGDTTSGTAVYTAGYYSGALHAPVESDLFGATGGQLLDTVLGPDAKIWTVLRGDANGTALTVRDGDDPTGTAIQTPYAALDARLAFDSSGTGVLAAVPTNQETEPVAYSVYSGGSWSSLKTVPHTWNVGDAFGLTGGHNGIHLEASTDNASYHPVVAALTGSGFGTVHAVGDTSSCAPSSHDLVTDASGRLADVSAACNSLRLADLPDAANGGFVDLRSGGVLAGGVPQVTTDAVGTGWVAWAIEDGHGGKLLEASRVRLPAAVVGRTVDGAPGSLTLSGPRSCLPPVEVVVAARARPAHGWKAGQPSLRLGSQPLHSGRLDGSTLSPGQAYTLTGTGQFTKHVVKHLTRIVHRHGHRHVEKYVKKHTVHQSLSTSLSFRTCGPGSRL